MVSASLRKSTATEFGLAFLLLFAFVLAQYVLPAGLDRLSTVAVRESPRAVGAVVYTALLLVALVLVVAASRRHTGRTPLATHERIQLGGAATLVTFVGAYWLHGVARLPAYPENLLQPLVTGGVAMALLAVGYARLRRIDLPAGLPDREGYSVAGGTVALAALAGLAWIAVVVVRDPPMLTVATGGGPGPAFGPELTAVRLVRDVVYPAGLLGVGSALLYNVGIQEPLREMGPARAVAAVPAVVGATTWGFPRLARTDTALLTVASFGGIAILSVLVAALAVAAVAVVSDALDMAATPTVAAAIGSLVVAVPLVAIGLVGPLTAGVTPYVLSFTAAAAVAAFGYERTRSVWVPAAAFAVHLAVVDWPVVVFVARLV